MSRARELAHGAARSNAIEGFRRSARRHRAKRLSLGSKLALTCRTRINRSASEDGFEYFRWMARLPTAFSVYEGALHNPEHS